MSRSVSGGESLMRQEDVVRVRGGSVKHLTEMPSRDNASHAVKRGSNHHPGFSLVRFLCFLPYHGSSVSDGPALATGLDSGDDDDGAGDGD